MECFGPSVIGTFAFLSFTPPTPIFLFKCGRRSERPARSGGWDSLLLIYANENLQWVVNNFADGKPCGTNRTDEGTIPLPFPCQRRLPHLLKALHTHADRCARVPLARIERRTSNG